MYLNGAIARKLANADMVEEIVDMVERKAAELEAARAAEKVAAE
jgi:(E)-4-hydroxy-3-methylbut-2-enyl-diphosphate synthase